MYRIIFFIEIKFHISNISNSSEIIIASVYFETNFAEVIFEGP